MNTRIVELPQPLDPFELEDLRNELRQSRRLKIDRIEELDNGTFRVWVIGIVSGPTPTLTLQQQQEAQADQWDGVCGSTATPPPAAGYGFENGALVPVADPDEFPSQDPKLFTEADLETARQEAALRVLQMINQSQTLAGIGLLAAVSLHVLQPTERPSALARRHGVSCGRVSQLTKKFKRLLKRF